jgi:hypothetical protein
MTPTTLNHLQRFVVPCMLLIVSGFSIWRFIGQVKKLTGPKKPLMRNVMISTFIATLSISFSGLVYFLWSENKGALLLTSAVFGFVIFVASVVNVTWASLRWNKLAAQR